MEQEWSLQNIFSSGKIRFANNIRGSCSSSNSSREKIKIESWNYPSSSHHVRIHRIPIRHGSKLWMESTFADDFCFFIYSQSSFGTKSYSWYFQSSKSILFCSEITRYIITSLLFACLYWRLILRIENGNKGCCFFDKSLTIIKPMWKTFLIFWSEIYQIFFLKSKNLFRKGCGFCI